MRAEKAKESDVVLNLMFREPRFRVQGFGVWGFRVLGLKGFMQAVTADDPGERFRGFGLGSRVQHWPQLVHRVPSLNPKP